MTFDEAMAYKLPSGKPMGTATKQEWTEAANFFAKEAARLDAIDPETMTEENAAKAKASLERQHEMQRALDAIEAELIRRGVKFV